MPDFGGRDPAPRRFAGRSESVALAPGGPAVNTGMSSPSSGAPADRLRAARRGGDVEQVELGGEPDDHGAGVLDPSRASDLTDGGLLQRGAGRRRAGGAQVRGRRHLLDRDRAGR